VTAFSKTACLYLAFTSSIFAQHLDFGFGFGVKGGVPFTDILSIPNAASQIPAGVNLIASSPITTLEKSSNYLIGPAAELRIPFGFAFEVDGLYHASGYRVTTNDINTTLPANAWEIPYLAKFRFPIPLLKPFISAGGAYRTFTDLPENLVTPTHNAFVLGGGLELRISRLRLSGEVRWLHWNSPPNNSNLARLDQNQGELLFGLIF